MQVVEFEGPLELNRRAGTDFPIDQGAVFSTSDRMSTKPRGGEHGRDRPRGTHGPGRFCVGPVPGGTPGAAAWRTPRAGRRECTTAHRGVDLYRLLPRRTRGGAARRAPGR